MSGRPPPFGDTWMQDVGNNPNITRDGPPAPLYLNAAPVAAPLPYGIPFPFPPPMMMWAPAPGPPMMPVTAAPLPTTAALTPSAPVPATMPLPPFYPGWGPWGAPAIPAPAPASAPTPDGKEHWIYPGGRDPGISYMYPDELCTFKRFLGDANPWETTMQHLDFNILQADVNWTIATFVSRLRNGDSTEGWAVSELVELDNGKWEKRTTLPAAGDKGRQTLKEVGWTGRRNGKDLPAIWVYVHKE